MQTKLSEFEGSEKVARGSEPKVANPLGNGSPHMRTIMSGHHIRLFARYQGKQPMDSEARANKMTNWTQYIWDRQTYSIIAGTRTIDIILEHEHGERVRDKLEFVRDMAARIGGSFARRHGLTLLTPWELSPHSHWVIEHERTGQILKPLAQEQGNDRVRAIFGDSSHPTKLEFIGPESHSGALGMDSLLLDLPTMVNAWNQGQIAQRQDFKVIMGAMGQLISQQAELLRRLKP